MILASKKLLVLALAGTFFISVPAFADASDSDVVSAINKAKILDAGYAVNAHISGDKVDISTYQNPSEGDDDFKIDAVLMAKAALDAVGDSAARVVVRFYSRDLSEYKEVAVTAGDVKGFGSGATSKEQLLSSLVLQTGRAENPAEKLSMKLQREMFSRPEVTVSLPSGSDAVEINTTMASTVSDDQCKLLALGIAMDASVPDNIKEIKVNLADPTWAEKTRQFTFKTSDLADLWRAVQSPLASIQAARVSPSLDSLRCVEGPLRPERQNILDHIHMLKDAGQGVGAYVTEFIAMENCVHRGNEVALKAKVDRLRTIVMDAQNALANAKNAKFAPAKTPTKGNMKVTAGTGRWALGSQPIVDSEVLTSPSATVRKYEVMFGAESQPMVTVLKQVGAVLQKNNRGSEADQYLKQATALQQKLAQQQRH